MTFSTKDLYDVAGLNSDGVAGFEAQVNSRSFRFEVVWPEHFQGVRIDAFRKGSRFARDWMAQRYGTGKARKMIRHEQLKKTGAMTVLSPDGAAELREEQLETLRSVVNHHRRVDEILAAEKAAESEATAAPTPS